MLTYPSGEEIRGGDRILYAGEPGEIEFVNTGPTGDPAMDWYLIEWPNGGCMIHTSSLGNVFVHNADEDLELVSRVEDPFGRL